MEMEKSRKVNYIICLNVMMIINLGEQFHVNNEFLDNMIK